MQCKLNCMQLYMLVAHNIYNIELSIHLETFLIQFKLSKLDPN